MFYLVGNYFHKFFIHIHRVCMVKIQVLCTISKSSFFSKIKNPMFTFTKWTQTTSITFFVLTSELIILPVSKRIVLIISSLFQACFYFELFYDEFLSIHQLFFYFLTLEILYCTTVKIWSHNLCYVSNIFGILFHLCFFSKFSLLWFASFVLVLWNFVAAIFLALV